MRPEPKPDWPRIARQKTAARDLGGALDAWQQALAQEPTSLDIAGQLASLAFRLGQYDMAEKFYAHLITRGHQDTATLAAYAAALREQSKYDAALDLLKTAAGQRPGESALWEGLGAIMAAKGDCDTALIFFDEALRLAPGDLNARFQRGCARLDKGETQAGLEDVLVCADGFRDPDNRASAGITAAQALLALGDLDAGWRRYAARHKKETVHEVVYDLAMPRWQGEDLQARRVFVSAEQGLGDEVLFATLLPDLAAEAGHLGIGVEPRLVALFQRSFPGATVVAHRTQTRDGRIHRAFPDLAPASFDLWAIMGDFLASRRARIADFPACTGFLTPDPARVAHWRDYVAALGPKPKVGLLWKSLKHNAQRDRYFSPFDQWRDILALDDVQIVNLQYGDTTAEVAAAQRAGFSIHTPEGIDLKQDLDDLAALCSALDLVLGPSNATSNIAAACGVPVWILTTPGAWQKLGTDRYPWYPTARTFAPASLGDWSPVMADIRAALTERFPPPNAPYKG